jgi:hypothetical protein
MIDYSWVVYTQEAKSSLQRGKKDIACEKMRCLLCTKRRRSFCSCYSWGPPTPAGKLWLIASFQLTHTSYCEDVGYVFWVSQNLTLILRGLLQPFVKIPNFQTSTYTSTYAHVEND